MREVTFHQHRMPYSSRNKAYLFATHIGEEVKNWLGRNCTSEDLILVNKGWKRATWFLEVIRHPDCSPSYITGDQGAVKKPRREIDVEFSHRLPCICVRRPHRGLNSCSVPPPLLILLIYIHVCETNRQTDQLRYPRAV